MSSGVEDIHRGETVNLTIIFRLLSFLRVGLGESHPDLTASMTTLGSILWDAGKLVDAEAVFCQVLDRQGMLPGYRPLAVAATLNRLGGVLEDEHKPEEAEPLYREALGLRRKELGAEHRDVANSLVFLGRVLCQMNRPAEAEPLIRESLTIRER